MTFLHYQDKHGSTQILAYFQHQATGPSHSKCRLHFGSKASLDHDPPASQMTYKIPNIGEGLSLCGVLGSTCLVPRLASLRGLGPKLGVLKAIVISRAQEIMYSTCN